MAASPSGRNPAVLICATAFLIVLMVLGYIEYLRRDGLHMQYVTKLERNVEALSNILEGSKSDVGHRVGEAQRAEMDGRGKEEMKRYAEGVGESMNQAVAAFMARESARQALSIATGLARHETSQADIDNFRAQLFTSTPFLDHYVKR